ncbi:hypothetical protein RND81_08G120700 [Saponaria officinalis]|uniref:Histone deacetylase complex subunit SAP18 n=1 Tax=Saponaria officinalis TaxID=3572 RepID=A0AAW1J6E2_SAPOF
MEGKMSREERERAYPPPPPPLRSSGRPLPPPPPRGGPPFRVQPVDREKTCPLLLRVFTKIGGHHTPDDFAVRGKEPKDEVQIYTWKDATLRELTDLVKEVSPAARRRDAKLSFATVYPDRNGRMQVKKMGETFSNPNKRKDDNLALGDTFFQTGDYWDVSIQ